jgi:Cytidylate kinase
MGMDMGIGISGSPGSGKTTAAKMVSKQVNRDFFTIGNIFRKIAEEKRCLSKN